jgi:MFS family permease
LKSKWNYDDQRAGFLMGIPDLICAVGTPLLGLAVDKAGKPGRVLPFSAVLATMGHSLLHLTVYPPFFGLILLGLASSISAATLWPCVPLLVESNQLGSAYGIITVALNLALATFPLIVAYLRSHSDSFFSVGLLFIGLSAIGLCFSLYLLMWDQANGSRLNQPPSVYSDQRSNSLALPEESSCFPLKYESDTDRDMSSSVEDLTAVDGFRPVSPAASPNLNSPALVHRRTRYEDDELIIHQNIEVKPT